MIKNPVYRTDSYGYRVPAVGEQEKDRIYNFVPAGQCGRYLNKISGGTVKVLELFLPDILNESTFLTVYK